MIEMKIAEAQELEKVYTLRREVFCEEQGYTEEQEFDEKDKTALQLMMIISGETVAVSRICIDSDNNCVIGRICVKKERRGEGLGRAMVLYAIDKCRRSGAASIQIMSELHAVKFYEALGFSQCGEQYSDGHLMRIPMQFDMQHSFGCCKHD